VVTDQEPGSFVFQSQAPDVSLIVLSSGGMRHALIEWDIVLILQVT
jgi:hypothetical protein